MLEIQVPIKGKMNNVIKMLEDNGLTLVHYGRMVANYYLPKDTVVEDTSKLKDLCVRLRYCVKEDYGEAIAIYHWQWIDDSLCEDKTKKEIEIQGLDNVLGFEDRLLKEGYKLVYTDIKDDNILVKNSDNIFADDNYVFQIQDLKGIALTCATDRKLYEGLPEEEQRKLLLRDMHEYGLEETSTEDINRFALLDDPNYKPMTLTETIDYINKWLDNKHKRQ